MAKKTFKITLISLIFIIIGAVSYNGYLNNQDLKRKQKMKDFSQAIKLHVNQPELDKTNPQQARSKYVFHAPKDGMILINFETEGPLEDVVYNIDVLNASKDYLLIEKDPPVKVNVKANEAYYISVFRNQYSPFHIEVSYK